MLWCETAAVFFFMKLPFLAQCVSQSKVIAGSSRSAQDGLIN